MTADRPHVLFVCVKNAGKSQMAAALMRRAAGDEVAVTSAGTAPGSGLNQLSADTVAEDGATFEGERPKQLTGDMQRAADRIIVIGAEAQVEAVDGQTADVEVWETDEPSRRGIEGEERMRLVRDDIGRRVDALVTELRSAPGA